MAGQRRVNAGRRAAGFLLCTALSLTLCVPPVAGAAVRGKKIDCSKEKNRDRPKCGKEAAGSGSSILIADTESLPEAPEPPPAEMVALLLEFPSGGGAGACDAEPDAGPPEVDLSSASAYRPTRPTSENVVEVPGSASAEIWHASEVSLTSPSGSSLKLSTDGACTELEISASPGSRAVLVADYGPDGTSVHRLRTNGQQLGVYRIEARSSLGTTAAELEIRRATTPMVRLRGATQGHEPVVAVSPGQVIEIGLGGLSANSSFELAIYGPGASEGRDGGASGYGFVVAITSETNGQGEALIALSDSDRLTAGCYIAVLNPRTASSETSSGSHNTGETSKFCIEDL